MILLFVLLGLCSSSLGQLVSNSPCPDAKGRPRVLELGDKWDEHNFCKNVVDNPFTMVLFFDPKCKECSQKMFEEYEKAACTLRKEGVQLAKVNCKAAGFWTCDLMRVGYFPDFKVFRYGWTSLQYLGPRSKDRFINFMHAVKKVPFGQEWLLDETRLPGEALKRLGAAGAIKRGEVAHVSPLNPCKSTHPPPEPIKVDKNLPSY